MKFLTLALTLSLFGSPVEAMEVAMQATGTVTSVAPLIGGGPVPTGVSENDAVTMEWSYNTGASGAPAGPSTVQYTSGLNLHFSVRINSLEWAGSGSWAYVGDTTVLDFLSFEAWSSAGAFFSSFPGSTHDSERVAFTVSDQAGPFSFLSSTALPAIAADLDLASIDSGSNTNGFIIAQNTSGTGWQIQWSIDPASVRFLETIAPPSLKVQGNDGTTMSLVVENLPAGQTFHLRSSTTLQGFLPLNPAVTFDSTTPQPFAIPVDPGRTPARFFQVFAGASP